MATVRSGYLFRKAPGRASYAIIYDQYTQRFGRCRGVAPFVRPRFQLSRIAFNRACLQRAHRLIRSRALAGLSERRFQLVVILTCSMVLPCWPFDARRTLMAAQLAERANWCTASWAYRGNPLLPEEPHA